MTPEQRKIVESIIDNIYKSTGLTPLTFTPAPIKQDIEKLQVYFDSQATYSIGVDWAKGNDQSVTCQCVNCKPMTNGTLEARRKFEAQMAITDGSSRVKVYTKEELIGIELLSRDDELFRKS